jgi:hypothetical protein
LEVHGALARRPYLPGQKEPFKGEDDGGIRVAATSPLLVTSVVSPFFTRSRILLLWLRSSRCGMVVCQSRNVCGKPGRRDQRPTPSLLVADPLGGVLGLQGILVDYLAG